MLRPRSSTDTEDSHTPEGPGDERSVLLQKAHFSQWVKYGLRSEVERTVGATKEHHSAV